MKLINEIDNTTPKSYNIVTEDGLQVLFTLWYSVTQSCWFFNMEAPTITVNSQRITSHPNMLRAFRNQLTFGLACYSTDGVDPFLLNDFSNGRNIIVLLNSDDVQTVEQIFFQ